jgi:hypothetical protein
MKVIIKYLTVALAAIITSALTAFLICEVVFTDDITKEAITDSITPDKQIIFDTKWEAEDIILDKELKNPEQVYNMIHEMANIKIIAEGNIIGAVKPMTKQRVERIRKAVSDLKIEDKKIIEILDRWSKQDFSQAVEDHNYIWSKYLNGTIGKAKALRK